MHTDTTSESRGMAFFRFVMNCMENSKRTAAALRRADNPSTEYQSWEYLAAFNIDLEKSYQRLPFGLIAAAIVKAKAEGNGSIGIGKAIARCYDEGNRSDQAKAKLRRLLACDSVEEVCGILRPLLRLIDARSTRPLNFAGLLDELLKFKWNSQWIKSRWAQDFYGREMDGEVKNDS